MLKDCHVVAWNMNDHKYAGKNTGVIKVSTKGTQCYAFNCYNYQNSDAKARGISFHRFPNKVNEPGRYAKWVKNCGRRVKPSTRTLICSCHFTSHSLDRTGQTFRLRAHAVPTIFNWPEGISPEIESEDDENTETPEEAVMLYNPQPKTVTGGELAKRVAIDHSYYFDQSTAFEKVKALEKTIEKYRRERRNAEEREKRARKKVLVANVVPVEVKSQANK